MTGMDNADQWTLRLAKILAGHLSVEDRAAALTDLAATHQTGLPEVDQTRQRILHLLAQPDLTLIAAPDQTGLDHRGLDEMAPEQGVSDHGVSDLGAPTPDLDLLKSEGQAGISLVAVDLGGLSVAAVRNWLTTGIEEVVLVDGHTTPALADRLRGAGITDARITLLRVDDAAVSWTQAFNIGLRAVCHTRLWVIADSTRLAPLADLPPLSAGSYAAEPGQSEAAGFLLDVNRSDLVAVGGFNEYLESPDGAAEELAGRLSALGLQRHPLPLGLVTQGRKTTPAQIPVTGTLRDVLRQSPSFAALQNRFIAAAMPDWTGAAQLPFSVAEQDDLGRHVLPKAAVVANVPLHIKTEAANHALIDLLRDTVGGQPERLSPRGLDTVLDRPVADVSAVDIAVAASNAPDMVRTRRAWLLIDLAADCLPLPGSPAERALKSLLPMAEAQGQTPVLRVDSPEAVAGLTPCPVITGAVDTAFWPTDLRELARPLGERAPRSATLPFTARTMTDLRTLARTPALQLRRPKIFIDAQHGLGNRLRAIASAGAIAAGTDRELVIIWQPDDHCDCHFQDLFHPYGAVLDAGFVSDAQSLGLQVFNYMEVEADSRKDAPIALNSFQDVYLRSAFPLVHRCSSWATQNQWLRDLQPTDVVRDLVDSVRSPNDLSIHIRMEGGAEAQHLPYESAANWTAEAQQEIDHWRKRSHFTRFLPRLDQLIAQGLAGKVFLATDTQSVYAEFETRYGDRVTRLPRPASDRSTPSIIYALTDAILLGQAPRLLGSTWSSFSELAARLAVTPLTVELTGRDF